MTESLGTVKDTTATAVPDSKIILGVGGLVLVSFATGSVAGGLVRALSLGFKSYFKTTHPLSVRKSDVKKLSDSLLSLRKGDYIVVTGGKGIGKTCLINTTLNRHHGVVQIRTKSGADKDVIVDQALRALAGFRSRIVTAEDRAHRLLFFYSLLFKRSPIMVLRVLERESGEPYGHVTAAVRELADTYKLRVVVDCSPNSLPPNLTTTNREEVIAVEPLSKEQIESVPEFKELIDFLKRHRLDEPVWKVLGGSPSLYQNLNTLVVDMLRSLPHATTDEMVNQVKDHLHSVLLKSLIKNVAGSSSNTKHILKIFREKQTTKIPMAELVAMGLRLDLPNQVFHEVTTKGRCFIEPVSQSISLIISENVTNAAGVRELRDTLFKTT